MRRVTISSISLSFGFAFIIFTYSFAAGAEENKGFSLSNIFQIKKATEVENYAPIEQKKSEPALVLTGRSGPSMPAVPAGDIKKEVIVKTKAPEQSKKLIKFSSATTEKPLPPTTLKYNPKIPFLSLIFQNGFQKNLEPAHKDLLRNTIAKINTGYYRGVVRIQSFSDKGHQTAMDRAQKVRRFMIDNNIPMRNIEAQALPGLRQGNVIHVFLLGEK